MEHPPCYASLLTPFIETDSHSPNFTGLPLDLIKGEAEYKVEDIQAHQQFGKNKRLQYLLKWKGYLESDNT
jgi:Chromo (CHRromatin Organisation MOdifier) domain